MDHILAKKKVPSACVCLSGKFDMDKNRGQQNGGVKTLVSFFGSSFMPYGAPILSHVSSGKFFVKWILQILWHCFVSSCTVLYRKASIKALYFQKLDHVSCKYPFFTTSICSASLLVCFVCSCRLSENGGSPFLPSSSPPRSSYEWNNGRHLFFLFFPLPLSPLSLLQLLEGGIASKEAFAKKTRSCLPPSRSSFRC